MEGKEKEIYRLQKLISKWENRWYNGGFLWFSKKSCKQKMFKYQYKLKTLQNEK